MKKTLVVSMAVFVVGILAISRLSVGEQFVEPGQVDQAFPELAVQDPVPPNPQEPAPAATPAQDQQSPSDVPAPQTQESVLEAPIFDYYQPAPPMVAPAPTCCDCCCAPCCCPVPTKICLIEPNCCCEFEICVNLPPCCCGEAPVVSWRDGILGRQIAWLCWPCCNKRVKVVLPVFGGPRVFE